MKKIFLVLFLAIIIASLLLVGVSCDKPHVLPDGNNDEAANDATLDGNNDEAANDATPGGDQSGDESPATNGNETYAVIFNVDGAEFTRVEVGEGFALPDAPNKANHEFVGWYYDTGFEVPFDERTIESTQFAANLNVYAKFREVTGGGSTETLDIPVHARMEMFSRLDIYLDRWFAANPQDATTDQSDLLAADIKKQELAFSYATSDEKIYKPSCRVSYQGNYEYSVNFNWGGGVIEPFVKSASRVEYKPWSGKFSEVSSEWESEDSPSVTMNKIVEAAVNTINLVTGNAVTGVFGADGVIGFSMDGSDFALRIKGNIDGVTETNNEFALIIVDKDLNECAGLYYKAEAEVKNNKVYFKTAKRDRTGKLIRQDGALVYDYKYIDYAYLIAFIEAFFPDSFGAPNDGVLSFKDNNGNPIVIDGLSKLISVLDPESDSFIFDFLISAIAHNYEHEGRYYIDFDLGKILSKVRALGDILPSFELADGTDIVNVRGLFGHITLSAKINDDKTLSDFEFAVNIPECAVSLVAPDDPNFSPIHFPALSFAVYIQDFSFLTSDKVDVMLPEEELEKAVYFCPTNLDVSGDIHINRVEGSEVTVNDAFHFDFVSNVNLFEIIENGDESEAKVALKIRRTKGSDVYDEVNSENFLTFSFEADTQMIYASGTFFGLGDNGEKLYVFSLADMDLAIAELETWLGWDTMQGIGFDSVLGHYIQNAELAKESAKALLENNLYKALTKYYAEQKSASTPTVVAPADTDVDDPLALFGKIHELYSQWNAYDNFGFSLENGAFNVNITKDLVNAFIDVVNTLLDEDFDEVTDFAAFNFTHNRDSQEGKTFIDFYVDYMYDWYHLIIDQSEEDKIKITFNRDRQEWGSRAVELIATEIEPSVWTIIVSCKARNADMVVVDTINLSLSDVNIVWGANNADKVLTLLPTESEKAAAEPIFPADGTGLGTQAVKFIMDFLNRETIEPVAEAFGKIIVNAFFLE